MPAFPDLPVLVGQSLALDFAGDAETQPASDSGSESDVVDEPSMVLTPVGGPGALVAVPSPPKVPQRGPSREVVGAAPESPPPIAATAVAPPVVEHSATSLSQLLGVDDRSRSLAEPAPDVLVPESPFSRDSKSTLESARANGSSRSRPTKRRGGIASSMRVIDIAWLAGLFESVGRMSIAKDGGTRLTIRMSDRDVVDRVNALVPCTGIKVVKPKPKPENGNEPCIQYAWRISDSGKVREVLTLLLPWFGERQAAKAREVLAHLDARPEIDD